MCYAIPGKVISITGKTAVISYFGEEKKAYNELDDLKIGDYIYAQGGFAIKKLAIQEAESILSVWKETFFELQELDLSLSKIDLEQVGLDKEIVKILDRASQNLPLNFKDMHSLMHSDSKDTIDYIMKVANFLRQRFHKNSCCVHGIIEISNNCKRYCKYCGISNDNKELSRYTMTHQEIFDAAYEAVNIYGFHALVLQSGENSVYNIEELASVIKRIKIELGALVFISFGDLTEKELIILYEAGARGILLRFETSNPELYHKLHPGQDLETRLQVLRTAYKLGYLIITGALIGLPGQSENDLINDIMLCRELHAEMYSFGPFIPVKGSKLQNSQPPLPELVLKIIALSRLYDPENAKILVTTAFETLSSNAGKDGLLSGASSVMLNVTPIKYRKLYSIYPDRAHQNETIQEQIDYTLALLRSLGRAPTDLGSDRDYSA